MEELTRPVRAGPTTGPRSSQSPLNCQQTIALDGQQRQVSGRVGSGVDVDAVRADIGRADRRMTVNDIFAEALLGGQEFLADPEQIRILLAIERDARLDAGMDEKKSPQVKEEGNCWRKAKCSGGSARFSPSISSTCCSADGFMVGVMP